MGCSAPCYWCTTAVMSTPAPCSTPDHVCSSCTCPPILLHSAATYALSRTEGEQYSKDLELNKGTILVLHMEKGTPGLSTASYVKLQLPNDPAYVGSKLYAGGVISHTFEHSQVTDAVFMLTHALLAFAQEYLDEVLGTTSGRPTFCMKCTTRFVKLLHCQRCKYATYCSPTCQKEDWTRHKAECKMQQEAAKCEAAGAESLLKWQRTVRDELAGMTKANPVLPKAGLATTPPTTAAAATPRTAKSDQDGGGGAVSTLEAAVMTILAEMPAIGVKKLVATVRSRFPALEATGVQVNAKRIKTARDKIQAADGGLAGGLNSLALSTSAVEALGAAAVGSKPQGKGLIYASVRCANQARAVRAVQLIQQHLGWDKMQRLRDSIVLSCVGATPNFVVANKPGGVPKIPGANKDDHMNESKVPELVKMKECILMLMAASKAHIITSLPFFKMAPQIAI